MKLLLMNKIFYIFFVFTFLFSVPESAAHKSPFDWATTKLDYVRKEKINALKQFTDRIHSIAKQATMDKKLIAFFEMNRKYFDAVKGKNKIPDSLSNDIKKLQDDFDTYYFYNYFVFYDILFINNYGETFYTIRKEKTDTYVNITQKKETIGALSEVIDGKPSTEVFIDFYDYKPSSEAAAFFVEPIFDNGVQLGWIALQCTANKFNSIFTATDDLGKTGETFLVNHNGLMLTESRFKGYSTILKLRLDDRNVKGKYQDRIGHRIVTDYRGITALSSFEVFEFLGSKWLVIAKIDEDEILTEHYKQYKKYYQDLALEYITNNPLPFVNNFKTQDFNKTFRVDMDEFLKAENGEVLETRGVVTCTALVATIPERFSYVAHMSNIDKVYNGHETNLLELITKKIKEFDIYPCERRDVSFFVVAPHLDSIANIIDELVEDGFFLSQISLLYNPVAESASIYSDYKNNSLVIKWVLSKNKNETLVTSVDPNFNIGKIINKILTDQ